MVTLFYWAWYASPTNKNNQHPNLNRLFLFSHIHKRLIVCHLDRQQITILIKKRYNYLNMTTLPGQIRVHPRISTVFSSCFHRVSFVYGTRWKHDENTVQIRWNSDVVCGLVGIFKKFQENFLRFFSKKGRKIWLFLVTWAKNDKIGALWRTMAHNVPY